jgi:hypothetical protein
MQAKVHWNWRERRTSVGLLRRKPTRASQEPAVSDAVLFVCWWLKDAHRVPALGTLICNQTRLVHHRRDSHDLRHVCLLTASTLLQLGTLATLLVGHGHT